jgi:hypothetical protein
MQLTFAFDNPSNVPIFLKKGISNCAAAGFMYELPARRDIIIIILIAQFGLIKEKYVIYQMEFQLGYYYMHNTLTKLIRLPPFRKIDNTLVYGPDEVDFEPSMFPDQC